MCLEWRGVSYIVDKGLNILLILSFIRVSKLYEIVVGFCVVVMSIEVLNGDLFIRIE